MVANVQVLVCECDDVRVAKRVEQENCDQWKKQAYGVERKALVRILSQTQEMRLYCTEVFAIVERWVGC